MGVGITDNLIGSTYFYIKLVESTCFVLILVKSAYLAIVIVRNYYQSLRHPRYYQVERLSITSQQIKKRTFTIKTKGKELCMINLPLPYSI